MNNGERLFFGEDVFYFNTTFLLYRPSNPVASFFIGAADLWTRIGLQLFYFHGLFAVLQGENEI